MIKKNSTYLGDTAGTLIKNTHDILDKPSAQFLPGTPLKCIYFNIDRKRSIYSYGSKTVNNYYGGSIKYKQINDFVIHHITDTITNAGDSRNESFDYIFNEDPFEAYLIPGTYVRPNVGDRIAFEFDDYQTMFMVTESAPESTIVSRPVFRIKIVRDNQTQARTDQRGKPYDIRYTDFEELGLLTGKYNFKYEFIGTEYHSVIEQTILNILESVQNVRRELNYQYMSIFYNAKYDNIIYFESNEEAYICPFLVFIQNEFRLLKYEEEENDLILHHLTSMDISTTREYQLSGIRNFLLANNKDIGSINYTISKYTDDRLFSPINSTRENYNIMTIRSNTYVPGEGEVLKEIQLPAAIQNVFDAYKTDTLTLEIIEENLNNYRINFDKEEIITVPLTLFIMDLIIKDTLRQIKINYF